MKQLVFIFSFMLLTLIPCAMLFNEQAKVDYGLMAEDYGLKTEDSAAWSPPPLSREGARGRVEQSTISNNEAVQTPTSDLELPQFTTDRPSQIIQHFAYTVSYNPQWFIPNWVAYALEREELEENFPRTNNFFPDPEVKDNPVVTSDYSRSGYDRGHMAPAADMRFSAQAMVESFYMTNICPQDHNNNGGDWKDLEELVRDYARQFGTIYICTGPIVQEPYKTIGKERKIVVPTAFYKVLLRQKEDLSYTSIGFVMPNAPGARPLMTYMHTIDEVEQMTGIDFFYQLDDDIEDLVEADYDLTDWTIKR